MIILEVSGLHEVLDQRVQVLMNLLHGAEVTAAVLHQLAPLFKPNIFKMSKNRD